MKGLDGLLATLVLVALTALVVHLARTEAVSGRVRIVDGDSLVLNGRAVRLAGIDAPELAQLCGPATLTVRCGERARDALRTLVGDEPVDCRIRGRDRYRRDLADCSVGGADLGARLVRDGQAIAYGRFEAEEREARHAHRGLWAAPFERPSEWRRRHDRRGAES